MENNTTAAVKFSEIVSGLPVGTVLIKQDGEKVENGYWTGAYAFDFAGAQNGLVYNKTTGGMQYVQMDAPSQWSIDPFLTPNETVSALVKGYGQSFAQVKRLTKDLDSVRGQLHSLRSDAQAALANWADEHIDSDSADWSEFNDLMVDLGLDGLKRNYYVTVSVTYQVQVEVEATSEDAARDEVENDLSYYVSDNIDTSYYEDYKIDLVEEA